MRPLIPPQHPGFTAEPDRKYRLMERVRRTLIEQRYSRRTQTC